MATYGEWIEWNGGEQPVADDVMVQTIMRDESESSFEDDTDKAGDWYWEHDGDRSDIIKYRIVTE